MKFYRKDYKYVGKVIGRFYDSDGQVTEYWKKLQVSKSYSFFVAHGGSSNGIEGAIRKVLSLKKGLEWS